MGKENGTSANDDLASRLMDALRHPIRRRILNALAREPASAKVLSLRFGVSLGLVSYHLNKVLHKELDLLTVVERNSRRGAMETVLALKTDGLVDTIDWPAIPEPLRSGLRGLALSSFQSAAVAALEAEAGDPKASNVYRCRPVSVDETGQREIGKAIEEFNSQVKAIEGRCAGLDPLELVHLIVGTAAFETAPFANAGSP